LGFGCQAVVSLLADGVVWMTERSVATSLGGQEATQLFTPAGLASDANAGLLDRGAIRVIGGWRSLILGTASAFPLAYLFSVATGVYLLLRQLVDSTEMDDISVDEPRDEESMPPLTRNPETNVPQVTKDGDRADRDESADETNQADSENAAND
jgi:hypothetical protein